MKAVVAFNQEKALVGAFSEIDRLHSTSSNSGVPRSGVSVDTKPFLWNNYGPDHKYPASSPAGSGVPGICSPTSGAADSVCSPVTPHQVGPARALDINVH